MKQLRVFAQWIDKVNGCIAHTAAWLALGMVLVMSCNVITRYLLNSGAPWEQELVRYMHGILFLSVMGYALKEGAHVRVDVFYQNFSVRAKAWVDILGTIFLLFPMGAAMIVFSYDFVTRSWGLQEGSSEFHGMPGVFVFKGFIWVGAVLLMLQGVSQIIHACMRLQTEEDA